MQRGFFIGGMCHHFRSIIKTRGAGTLKIYPTLQTCMRNGAAYKRLSTPHMAHGTWPMAKFFPLETGENYFVRSKMNALFY